MNTVSTVIDWNYQLMSLHFSISILSNRHVCSSVSPWICSTFRKIPETHVLVCTDKSLRGVDIPVRVFFTLITVSIFLPLKTATRFFLPHKVLLAISDVVVFSVPLQNVDRVIHLHPPRSATQFLRRELNLKSYQSSSDDHSNGIIIYNTDEVSCGYRVCGISDICSIYNDITVLFFSFHNISVFTGWVHRLYSWFIQYLTCQADWISWDALYPLIFWMCPFSDSLGRSAWTLYQ